MDVACSRLFTCVLVVFLAPAAAAQPLNFADYTGAHTVQAGTNVVSFSGPRILTQPPPIGGANEPLEIIGEVSALMDPSCAGASVSAVRGEVFANSPLFDWDFSFTYSASAVSTNPADELDPCWPGFTGTATLDSGVFTAVLFVPSGATSLTVKYGIEETLIDATGTFGLKVVDSKGFVHVDVTGPTGSGIASIEDLLPIDLATPPNGETYIMTFSGDAVAQASPPSVGALAEATARIVLTIDQAVGVSDRAPRVMNLHPAMPNPFGLETTIRYDLAQPAVVDLQLHDTAGRLVRTLERSTWHEAGRYATSWDGRDARGRHVPAGVYFCTLSSRDFRDVRRLVVAR